jgi:hypothetical protein
LNEPSSLSKKLAIGSTEIQLIGNSLQLKIQEKTWLLITKNQLEENSQTIFPKTVSVLLWPGKYLRRE